MEWNVETPRFRRRDGIAVDKARIEAFLKDRQWLKRMKG
jgi:hypothetical protein